MDKETRSAIERATQRARKLLEEDFFARLEGTFDILRDGTVASKAGSHLGPREVFQRDKIVAAIEHKRAAGMSAAEAVADYVRDAAFTTLNRFVALKMLEARELLQECITKGEQSAGYTEFCGMAQGVKLLPDSEGYRLYIESLFDELSTEVKVLFDRRDPASVLWPKRATFEALLEILNGRDFASVWAEDETIGWVYQFFNGGDERRAMRGASQAPRNSRELAVRNQFFTPRYVVQFLTDNTLGRLWYQMRGGETELAGFCEYLVQGDTGSPCPKRDPRDLKVLDPACGSGHFLLYAFDLLIRIYEEAHRDPTAPPSEATGKRLSEDYPTVDALRRALPSLVLAHNLHGVDIDARCAQIAQIALWMRAQRAYRDFSIPRAERPIIRRSNIVVAEPLVTDKAILKEFLSKLGDVELNRLFTTLVDTLKLAGDLGLLLHLEGLVQRGPKRGEMGNLFAPPEERMRAAIERFATAAGGLATTRRKLFAGDAVQGVGLLELAEKKYDVILMNPPFGQPSSKLPGEYKGLPKDLYCCFVERASTLLRTDGRAGILTSASFRTYVDYSSFRERFFVSGRVPVMADLGWGVLDGAYVETAAYVVVPSGQNCDEVLFLDVRDVPDRSLALMTVTQGRDGRRCYRRSPQRFGEIAGKPLIYWWPDSTWKRLAGFPRLDSLCEAIGKGAGPHALFYRLRWEVSPENIGLDRRWATFTNGGSFSPFRREDWLLLHWENGGALVKSYILQKYPYLDGNTEWNIQMEPYYGRPGLTYGKKTTSFSSQVMPAGSIFSFEGMGVFPVSQDDLWWLLAYLNSGFVRWYLNSTCGLHKNPPYVRNVPVPHFEPDAKKRLGELARSGWLVQLRRAQHDERSPLFRSPWPGSSEEAGCDKQIALILTEVDAIVEACTGLCPTDFAGATTLTADEDERDDDEDHTPASLANDSMSWPSWAVGIAFGRFDIALAREQSERMVVEPLAPLPSCVPSTEIPTRGRVYVDDPGHADDLGTVISAILSKVERATPENLSAWLCKEFFPLHIKAYSKNRRKAPIYWHLATPSASYSVWLYLHSFTKDTLYKVQNEYVAPKLAHEERKLESMRRELGEAPRAAERKALGAQEAFVEELRGFLDEVKRVAPLWNPNLDDGVIINFAPLWRLVPHYKPWQKELKATWDALAAGEYDWAHLAMHLWPERVVPKCATDRSLAIAHGLEEVFWAEGADGKWKARAKPLRAVEALVQERSSAAVKEALKNLGDAPTAQGGKGAARSRGPR